MSPIVQSFIQTHAELHVNSKEWKSLLADKPTMERYGDIWGKQMLEGRYGHLISKEFRSFARNCCGFCEREEN